MMKCHCRPSTHLARWSGWRAGAGPCRCGTARGSRPSPISWVVAAPRRTKKVRRRPIRTIQMAPATRRTRIARRHGESGLHGGARLLTLRSARSACFCFSSRELQNSRRPNSSSSSIAQDMVHAPPTPAAALLVVVPPRGCRSIRDLQCTDTASCCWLLLGDRKVRGTRQSSDSGLGRLTCCRAALRLVQSISAQA